MSPEHIEPFRRILADFAQRPGGDYAGLLRRGQVVSPSGVDIDALAGGDPMEPNDLRTSWPSS